MNTTPLRHGLWGVLATPFHGPALEVDHDSLRREVDLYLGVPADGLVVLGVFGEGVALDTAEQAAVVETVAKQAPGTPLVVGVSARTTAVAVEQARTAAAAAGPALAGVMVQVNTADPAVLARHLDAVHRVTGAGIVLQDYPEASGVRITAAAVLAGARRLPVRGGGEVRGSPDQRGDRRAHRGDRRPRLRRARRGGPARRARRRRRRGDDRLLPPRGAARRARRLGTRRLHRGPGGVRAVAAAGELRGPAGHRTGSAQGDPAATRGVRRVLGPGTPRARRRRRY